MFNYINYRNYSVRYDEGKKCFEIFHSKFGKIIDELRVIGHLRDLNNVYYCVNFSDFKRFECTHEKHLSSNALSVCFSEGPEILSFYTITVEIDCKGVSFRILSNADKAFEYKIEGTVTISDDAEKELYALRSKVLKNQIQSAYGAIASPKSDMLFNRIKDTALQFKKADRPNLKFDTDKKAYTFSQSYKGGTELKEIRFEYLEDVYKNRYDINYKPINKNGMYKRPPCGFMTWYALMFTVNEQNLLENVKVQAEKLKKYGADTIWVDWEWYHNGTFITETDCDTFNPDKNRYPNGMKYLADSIREQGLIPAVWVGFTHEVKESEYIKENPQTVLINKQSWCGPYFLDPTHPDFLNGFLTIAFNQVKEWGFEAVKWDALPKTLDYLDQCHDDLYDKSLSSEDALRGAIQKARDILGEDTYMLSCHGEAYRDITAFCDIFDAARIGADIFGWQDFKQYCVERTCFLYPLHNIVEILDPDNVVLRDDFNNDIQAISRSCFVSMCGMPITLGDDLRFLQDSRVDIVKRAIPPMDIRSMLFEAPEFTGEILLINLFINTGYEEYRVINFFNTLNIKTSTSYSFDELDLEENAEYLVFDYWHNEFIGKINREISLDFDACETRILSFRKFENRPMIVFTDRHITQGACEIKNMKWDNERNALCGTSATVEGDSYTMKIYVPNGFNADDKLTKIADNLYSFTIEAATGADVDWEFIFTK